MAYTFFGNPVSQAAAVAAHRDDNNLRAAQAQAQAYGNQQVPNAQANVLATLYSQPANFANAIGNAYGNQANAVSQASNGYMQGLGTLGNSAANAYAGYAGGLGNTANAMANERSNWYGANAMAEAARQGAMGNIGAAALGAYGGAANSALNAWAANQTAYNKAMSDMVGANQSALAGYGASRNSALGSLGDSYASAGKGFAGANAIGDLSMSAGMGLGNGFNATGPNGNIASGSYDSGSGGFSMQARRNSSGPGPYAAQTFGGLDQLQNNLMSNDIGNALTGNYNTGLYGLNAQHLSSRNQPSEMLGQSLSGLMTLGSQGYGNSNRGMDQFYASQNDPRNRADFSPVLHQLASGYKDSSSQLDRLGGQMGSGFNSTNTQLNNNFHSTLGTIGDLYRDMNTQSQRAQGRLLQLPPTLDELRQQWAAQDAMQNRRNSLFAARN